eukprot:4989918-Ditylum_brightwellii.AAC.1
MTTHNNTATVKLSLVKNDRTVTNGEEHESGGKIRDKGKDKRRNIKGGIVQSSKVDCRDYGLKKEDYVEFVKT